MPIQNAILVKNTQRMQTGKHVHAIDSMSLYFLQST